MNEQASKEKSFSSGMLVVGKRQEHRIKQMGLAKRIETRIFNERKAESIQVDLSRWEKGRELPARYIVESAAEALNCPELVKMWEEDKIQEELKKSGVVPIEGVIESKITTAKAFYHCSDYREAFGVNQELFQFMQRYGIVDPEGVNAILSNLTLLRMLAQVELENRDYWWGKAEAAIKEYWGLYKELFRKEPVLNIKFLRLVAALRHEQEDFKTALELAMDAEQELRVTLKRKADIQKEILPYLGWRLALLLTPESRVIDGLMKRSFESAAELVKEKPGEESNTAYFHLVVTQMNIANRTKNRMSPYKGVDQCLNIIYNGEKHSKVLGASPEKGVNLEELKRQILEHPIEEYLANISRWRIAPHTIAEFLRAAEYAYKVRGYLDKSKWLGENIRVLKEARKAPSFPIPGLYTLH